MKDEQDNDTKEIDRFLRWALPAICFFVFWGVFAALVIFRSSEGGDNIAKFGDAFGMVNAAFASIAAGGAVFAVILQSKELKLARRELRENRVEMLKSAQAQDG